MSARSEPIAWEREWRSDGVVSHRFGRAADMLVAEWAGVGRLFASRDGVTSRFEVDEGAVPEAARRIQEFVAPSLLRHLRGEIALHASAVVVDGRATAFLGASGAGKSTIASALCARAGVRLAADDMLYVSRADGALHVIPTERANRLAQSADAPTRKRPVAPTLLAPSSSRLVAIIELVKDETAVRPRLSPLDGAARFDTVNRAFVRFTSDDDEINIRDFRTIGSLAADVRVLALHRAWNATSVEQSVDVVREAQATWSES